MAVACGRRFGDVAVAQGHLHEPLRRLGLVVAFVLGVVGWALSGGGAQAATCALPNVLTNGQTADATQVMADLNTLLDCVNLAITPSGTTVAGSLAKFSSTGTITSGDLSGDCATAGSLSVICTKTNGVAFGAFATGTDAANLTGTVSVNRFNSGTGASTSTFLRGDGTWVSPPGQVYSFNTRTGAITLTGSDVTTALGANSLALSYLVQVGGNSYLGNTSSSTGNITAYTLPSCTGAANALRYTLGSGFSCGTVSAVSGGSNPFYIGTPNVQSGIGAPSISSDPVGSLYMRADVQELYQQAVASGTVPNIVQVASSANNTSATFSSTPTAGDLLVAVCWTYPQGAPGVAAGWTSAGIDHSASVSDLSESVGYRTAVTGESTTQTPCPNKSPYAQGVTIYEVSGVTGWTSSFEASHYVGSGATNNYTTTHANDLVLGSYGAWGSSSDPGAGSQSGLSGGTSTAHTCCSSGGSGWSAITGAQQFASSSSSVSTTPSFSSGGPSSLLLILKPTSAGWQKMSPLSLVKNGGTTLETNPLSLNVSTGLSATTDGAGNVTVTATGTGTVSTTGSPASGNLSKFSGATSITNGDLSGDCTTSGTLVLTCTKSSGTLLTSTFLQIGNNLSDIANVSTARTNLGLGTFATQNYAAPPAIGATTPASGKFSSLQDTAINGGTQCVQADASGNLSGTGSTCGSGGGGGSGTVTSVTCGANTITVSGVCLGGSLMPQGRLTLISGAPVMASDQTAKSQIYYDCYVGKFVPYYDGSTDQLDSIGACEISTTMQTSGTGVTNNAGVFDIFWSAANHTICVATNGSGGGWASDTGGSNTARGTGYSQVHNTRGYVTNANAISHCYNGSTDYGSLSADQATYLGTLYTTAAGQTGMQFKPTPTSGGSNNMLGLYNAYNRVKVQSRNLDSGGAYSYSGGWRATRASNSNRISFVDGLQQSFVDGIFINSIQTNGCTAGAGIGMSLDSTSATPDAWGPSNACNNGVWGVTTHGGWSPQLGFHFIQAQDYAGASITFDNSGTAPSAVALQIVLEMHMPLLLPLAVFRRRRRAVARPSRKRTRLVALFLGLLGASAVEAASVSYTYDPVGRVATALYDNGVCVVYVYDPAGNRTSQTNTVSSAPETPIWGTGTWGCFQWTMASAQLMTPPGQARRGFAAAHPDPSKSGRQAPPYAVAEPGFASDDARVRSGGQ